MPAPSDFGRDLVMACLSGDQPEAERLLALGADPRFYLVEIDKEPLSAAFVSGCSSLIDLLWDRIEPEPGDSLLDACFEAAVAHEHGDLAARLLERGASLSFSALSVALDRLKPQAILHLFEMGAFNPAHPDIQSDLDEEGSFFDRLFFESALHGVDSVCLRCASVGLNFSSPSALRGLEWVASQQMDSVASQLLSSGLSLSKLPAHLADLWERAFPSLLLAHREKATLAEEAPIKAPRRALKL